MVAGATHGLTFRLPATRAATAAPSHERAFETWRASIWTAALVGTAGLVTTVLNVVPGPADEIVMASAYSLTGILGHVAPLSE